MFELLQRWLRCYIARSSRADHYRALMARLRYAAAGRKFSREEMNER